MNAPPKPMVPVIEPAQLSDADGILFGISARFGSMSAQMKSFWDRTGALWQSGGLVGKPAGFFFSTSTQGGGQETAALTCVTQLAHHGMIFVPLGYTVPALFNMSEPRGGSPYGAGTLAGGDGSRFPSELEKGVAQHQGESFTRTAIALKKGRAS
eukprot:CAMPEP_0175830266 /NCGR_PEP_ID=MMETSP0107_2-20121207/13831_1 /TAXON_ID=195067 ORGANISM="Goniomonas pacifica, Strain CCMP1869" /NCGR_SAMPLE_ID=MMETSP0107_2 /ASSEMBLY_ACC=CAM_ASM_000203 /LENGTH=154 /DNA_ID=CAMNT_0017143209 /DNA_START=66 /DNA_END=530 /DNA_ORIENTATION=-